MRSVGAWQLWGLVHQWTSLICTLFILMLCITGLPLIFHHEIDRALGGVVVAPDMPGGAPRASLDDVMRSAQGMHPHQHPLFASHDLGDDTIWFITMADQDDSHLDQVAVDSRTARVLGAPVIGDSGVMAIMLSLHTDLFAGTPGKLFLGCMGVLLLLSLLSGAVLYAPFMHSEPFGSIRHRRSSRIKWLDLHNGLGIVLLAWTLVVAVTGVINAWSDLAVKSWQADQVKVLDANALSSGPAQAREGLSLQMIVEHAQRAQSQLGVGFVAFPGTSFAGGEHFGIYMRGTSRLTSRLVQPVFVDPNNGHTVVPHVPLLLTAVLLSQPLHFGDYGGLAMKVLWLLLDLLTIVVLVSGLVLWVQRYQRRHARPSAATKTALHV